MNTDSIADCFTRLGNASKAGLKSVEIPYSKTKESIVKLLQDSGFVGSFTVTDGGSVKSLVVSLRYRPTGEPVLEHVRRLSKPGQRVYVGSPTASKVRSGVGMQILSTPRGILSDVQAAEQRVGGELIGEVW